MKGLTIECTVCHVTGSTCPLVHTILQAMVCVSVFIILLTFVNKNISTESSKLHSNIMVTAKFLFLVTFINFTQGTTSVMYTVLVRVAGGRVTTTHIVKI